MLFKHHGETGNHDVSCFHHPRAIGPPLNPMECGFVQIGAGIEGVFDHLCEGMQAFEAVRTFGIAEFGLAQRSAQPNSAIPNV